MISEAGVAHEVEVADLAAFVSSRWRSRAGSGTTPLGDIRCCGPPGFGWRAVMTCGWATRCCGAEGPLSCEYSRERYWV